MYIWKERLFQAILKEHILLILGDVRTDSVPRPEARPVLTTIYRLPGMVDPYLGIVLVEGDVHGMLLMTFFVRIKADCRAHTVAGCFVIIRIDLFDPLFVLGHECL